MKTVLFIYLFNILLLQFEVYIFFQIKVQREVRNFQNEIISGFTIAPRLWSSYH